MSLPGGAGGVFTGIKAGGFILNLVRPSIPLDIQNAHRVEPRGYFITTGDTINAIALTQLGPGTTVTLTIFKTALGATKAIIGSGRIGQKLRSLRGNLSILPNLSSVHATIDTIVDANGDAIWNITPDIYTGNSAIAIAVLSPVRSNFLVIYLRPSPTTSTPTPSTSTPSTQLYHPTGADERSLASKTEQDREGNIIPAGRLSFERGRGAPRRFQSVSHHGLNAGISLNSEASQTQQESRGDVVPGNTDTPVMQNQSGQSESLYPLFNGSIRKHVFGG